MSNGIDLVAVIKKHVRIAHEQEDAIREVEALHQALRKHRSHHKYIIDLESIDFDGLAPEKKAEIDEWFQKIGALIEAQLYGGIQNLRAGKDAVLFLQYIQTIKSDENGKEQT